MDVQLFSRIYLPISLLMFVWLVFILPAIRQKQRTGKSPYVFGTTDNAEDFIARIYKLCLVLTVVMVLFYAIDLYFFQRLEAIRAIRPSQFKFAGMILLFLTTIWTVVAQRQMKNSWRIGIDHQNKTSLVTHGIFRVSRNPVFLGILLSYISVFLIIPNTVSLLVTIVIYIAMQIQIRLEESHLLESHGEEFKSYINRTRRWI